MEGRPTVKYGCGSSPNSLALSLLIIELTQMHSSLSPYGKCSHGRFLNCSAEPYLLSGIYMDNSHPNTKRQKVSSEIVLVIPFFFQFGGGLVGM